MLLGSIRDRGVVICPVCSKAPVRQFLERILRYLGLWAQGARVSPARAPPVLVDRVTRELIACGARLKPELCPIDAEYPLTALTQGINKEHSKHATDVLPVGMHI